MDYNEDKKIDYKGALDICICKHLRIQHTDGQRCVWCTCSSFHKESDSKNDYKNKS